MLTVSVPVGTGASVSGIGEDEHMTLESLVLSMADGWWYPSAVALLMALNVGGLYHKLAAMVPDAPAFTTRERAGLLMPGPLSLPLLYFPTAWSWISFEGSSTPGVPTLVLGAVIVLATVLGGLILVKRSRGAGAGSVPA